MTSLSNNAIIEEIKVEPLFRRRTTAAAPVNNAGDTATLNDDSALRRRRRRSKDDAVAYDDDGELEVKTADEDEEEEKCNYHEEKNVEDFLGLEQQQMGWFETFGMELMRGFSANDYQEQYEEKKNKVNAFIQAPVELEKFLYFGFFHCLDAFCYIFTILPLRCILNVLFFIFRLRPWRSTQTCDFIKILIIVFASLAMYSTFDASNYYHIIRGQELVKLYIGYTMLEVADKLLSSIGQDLLDSCMFLTSQNVMKWGRYGFLYFPGAVLYAYCHAFSHLLQGTILNLAFNSHGCSLLTILISKNFVEIKSSAFKKMNKPSLFETACSDVRERFVLLILVIFVLIRNMAENQWSMDYFAEIIPQLGTIALSEFLIDWFKHAFITKFNDISYTVYQDFSTTLAFDVAKSREKTASSDFADTVSRRMEFIPIPITVMLIHTIFQSVDMTSNTPAVIIGATWMLLFVIKIVNGRYLYSQATKHLHKYRTLQKEAESLHCLY